MVLTYEQWLDEYASDISTFAEAADLYYELTGDLADVIDEIYNCTQSGPSEDSLTELKLKLKEKELELFVEYAERLCQQIEEKEDADLEDPEKELEVVDLIPIPKSSTPWL